MAEYRIIRNLNGFCPQRRGRWGWDGITKAGKWYQKVIICKTIPEARTAIDKDFMRRSRLNSCVEGAEVEIYRPQGACDA